MIFQSLVSTPGRPTLASKTGPTQTPSVSVTISSTKETTTPESAESTHGSSTISSADDTESSEFELLSETITQLQQRAAETCHKSVTIPIGYTSEPNLTRDLAERNQKTGPPSSTTTVLTVIDGRVAADTLPTNG